MVRHSKLQKQILSLYRQFLRAGRGKPGFVPRIREEFRANAAIKKTDVMHIEYLCRRAQRQLEQLKDVTILVLEIYHPRQFRSSAPGSNVQTLKTLITWNRCVRLGLQLNAAG
ncbi:succinate dehydrogenase assembly factor 1, mitochondrial [Colossoma macropomum]|uniref:succinate dehydrogenase assembly factor 1, mitochondrial n=1 Tax=Colossoma macropomum TaxID=42526 RepID=UPI001864D81A|nr:succinate dehydrogenase assembly factor 1, mitochondrial [Colossoma macropomum]